MKITYKETDESISEQTCEEGVAENGAVALCTYTGLEILSTSCCGTCQSVKNTSNPSKCLVYLIISVSLQEINVNTGKYNNMYTT